MKTIKFLSIMLLLGCFALPSRAQSPQTSFKVQAGVSPFWVYDQAASPLVYRTNIFQAGLQFRRDGEKHSWDAALQGGYGSSKALGTGFREIRFVHQDIHETNNVVHVTLGGSLLQGRAHLGWAYRLSPRFSLGLEAADELYYAQGFVTPGLMNLAYLGPRAEYAIVANEKHQLRARVAVPALAFINRLGHHGSVSIPESGQVAGFFSQNFSVNTLNTFQRASLELDYQWRLSQRLSLGIDWSAFFMHHKDLSTLRAAKQSAMVSVTFHH